MLTLSNSLVKLLLPVLAIVIVFFIATKKLKYSLKEDLFIVTPELKDLLSWIFVYLIYMIGTDMIFNWRGAWNFQTWREHALIDSTLKILAIGILGPVAEELIFRGLLLTRLNRFKLNKWISLLIITALWTVIHIDYSIGILVLIFLNGIVLGLSLYFSGSLIIPIILHIIWNLYSIW